MADSNELQNRDVVGLEKPQLQRREKLEKRNERGEREREREG